jgi:hypothetical protein
MSELENQNNLVISADQVPIAAYQAIYHRITGRVETISRSYHGSYFLDFDKIESLYYKLDQATRQYQVHGKRCEFTFSIFEGENFRFTSLERLKFANLRAINKPTSAIGIEFDFLVVLPAEIE